MNTDCILTSVLPQQAARYGEREALCMINGDGKKLASLSYDELNKEVAQVACGLETLGVAPGDKVLIFSTNRPEMLVTDFACYANGAVPVSVYATSSTDQVRYIIEDCKPRLLMVGGQRQYDIIKGIVDQYPFIQQVISYDKALRNERIMMWKNVCELGRFASDMCRAKVAERTRNLTPDDTATLIYTSGTTGEPKAADLPHRCFDTTMAIHRERLPFLSDADTSLCFLPLCHIFEKAWSYFCLTMGMHITINEDPKEIAKALRHTRPTCMCSVPRFWEKAFIGINEKVATFPMLRRWAVKTAMKIGHKRNLKYQRCGKKAPIWLEALYKIADHNVLSTIRRTIGVDHGHLFPTAGAPVANEIVEYFRSMGVPMIVGYGLSETTATVTCYPNVDFEIGTVGTVMPRVQIKIAEPDPDAPQPSVGKYKTGEVLVKGPTVMRGYYHRPDATAEAFTEDGWFRTGDAGYIDDQGDLVLTDRIKDLFKTSNGKYIAPQAIESKLGGDPYIEQVAVVGESRNYVTAIIIPAFEALKEYARKHKIKFRTLEDLIHNSQIIKMLEARIQKLQKGLPSFEQIKKFTLLPNAFTIENGELTNTLKIRRPVIAAHYAKEIESMYA